MPRPMPCAAAVTIATFPPIWWSVNLAVDVAPPDSAFAFLAAGGIVTKRTKGLATFFFINDFSPRAGMCAVVRPMGVEDLTQVNALQLDGYAERSDLWEQPHTFLCKLMEHPASCCGARCCRAAVCRGCETSARGDQLLCTRHFEYDQPACACCRAMPALACAAPLRLGRRGASWAPSSTTAAGGMRSLTPTASARSRRR